MIQIQLNPEIEKKFNRLKDDLDFVMGLEEFIAEEYRMAFELTHDTLESYADGLRAELGDERYHKLCHYFREKMDEKAERHKRFDQEVNGISLCTQSVTMKLSGGYLAIAL